MSSIKDFFYPRADFFGPQADELTDLLGEVPIEHMISGCHAERIKGINALAQARICCEEWPVWQRYDGSIIYDKLPADVKKFFKPEYFDKEGYVDVENLHIFGKDFLLGWARNLRNDSKMASPFDRLHISQLVTCPALSIRLAEGQEFDPSQHREILLQDMPTFDMNRKVQLNSLRVQPISMYRCLNEVFQGKVRDVDVKEKIKHFEKVWKYALGCSKSPAQSNAFPTIVTLLFGIGLLALLKLKSNNVSEYYQRVIDVASRHFPPLWGSGVIAVSTHTGRISGQS